jgi:hypothetical protein
MAFAHGSKAKIYMNGYDVSPFTRSVSQASELDTASVDVMGGTYKQSVTGLLGATLNVSGFVDGAAAGSDVLFGPGGAFQTTTKSQVLYIPQGNTGGNMGYGMDAWESTYEVTTDIGDAGTFSAAFQSDVGLDGGMLVHAYQNEAAPGTAPSVSTGWQYGGGATTNGAVGYLMVGSAAASLAVTISSATATNGTYTTHLTFSTTSTPYTWQRSTVAVGTTINQFIRCVWTGTGTFAVLFARK